MLEADLERAMDTEEWVVAIQHAIEKGFGNDLLQSAVDSANCLPLLKLPKVHALQEAVVAHLA